MKLITLSVGRMDNKCYIIRSEAGSGILIDPGYEADKIIEALRDNEVTLAVILLTHGHFDHIGALREVYEATHAQVMVSRGDAELLTDPVKNVGARLHSNVHHYTLPDIPVSRLLSDGDEIVLDELSVRVFATPGHTIGSVVYALDDMLFTGDTLFRGSVGVVTHYGGDLEQEIESIARLARKLEGEYRVYPGHGMETTLETERRTNPYLVSHDDHL